MNQFHYNLRLEELFNLADLDIREGYFEEAVKKLEEILIEDPTFGKAYNHLGWLNETKFQNYPKAEELYHKAFQTAPNYPAIYTNYSVLLSTLGKYEQLTTVLEKGLNTPGVDKASMYNEFGIMHELQGNFNEAIEFYTKCAKTTLIKETMDRAISSMERCRTKMAL